MPEVMPWPPLPPPDPRGLLTALRQLLDMIKDGDVHAVDNLDDLFTRVVAALAELLDMHLSADSTSTDPGTADSHSGQVVQIVHEYLNQPLTLLWWHLLQTGDEPIPHIDDIAIWTSTDPAGQRREHAQRLWPQILAATTTDTPEDQPTPAPGRGHVEKPPPPHDHTDNPDTPAS